MGPANSDRIAPLKIAIFEDSPTVVADYRRLFGSAARVKWLGSPVMDESIIAALYAFCADLFIVDLILGADRDDGIKIIRHLQVDSTLRQIPIVIVSKLINESPAGQVQRARCLAMDGVVGALPKFPEFPSIDELSRLAKMKP